jgi:hypothetical protein
VQRVTDIEVLLLPGSLNLRNAGDSLSDESCCIPDHGHLTQIAVPPEHLAKDLVEFREIYLIGFLD